MLRRLTLDDIYDPDRKILFDGNVQPDIIWLDDDHFVQRKSDPKTQFTEWTKVHAITGAATPFYDVDKMQTALRALPGMSEDDAKRLAQLPNYVIDPDKTAVLLTHANDLFYYRFDSGRVIRLTTTAAPEVGEEFSPNG